MTMPGPCSRSCSRLDARRAGPARALQLRPGCRRCCEDGRRCSTRSRAVACAGAGAGWHCPEYEPSAFPLPPRVSRFAEALEIVVRLLRAERVLFDGRYHQPPDAVLLPRPARSDPSLVAARRPRMPRLTATWADAGTPRGTRSQRQAPGGGRGARTSARGPGRFGVGVKRTLGIWWSKEPPEKIVRRLDDMAELASTMSSPASSRSRPNLSNGWVRRPAFPRHLRSRRAPRLACTPSAPANVLRGSRRSNGSVFIGGTSNFQLSASTDTPSRWETRPSGPKRSFSSWSSWARRHRGVDPPGNEERSRYGRRI